MKNHLLIVFIVALFYACKKDTEFSKPYNTTTTFFTFTGIIRPNDNSTYLSSDNNLIICGNSGSNICLLKISKAGNQIWRKEFKLNSNSTACGVIETSNRDLLILGETSRNFSISSFDILLINTNSNGDTLWTKTYGSIDQDYGCQIIKTKDNNYLIAGVSYGDTLSAECDIYLIKVDPNGDELWSKIYKDQGQEVAFHVMQTQNGEYLITGTNEDQSSSRGLYLLKVDVGGNQLWNKTIGAGTWRWGYSAVELEAGDFMITGKYTSNGYSQVLLVKTDKGGNEIWQKEYGKSNLSETGHSIKQNSDGTFTITGSSYDVPTMQDDIILLKVDKNGNQLWYKKFGGSETDLGINLIKDGNGDNIITGTTYSYGQNASEGNIFMTKTDDDGNFK